MASKTNKKAEQKQKMVRVVAIVACCALLLTAILPYVASSLLRGTRTKYAASVFWKRRYLLRKIVRASKTLMLCRPWRRRDRQIFMALVLDNRAQKL